MNQDVNGTLTSSVWPSPGFANTLDQGGVAAGCGAGNDVTAHGGANASTIDETWDAVTTAGCGIAGGNANGVAFALTGISVEMKLEFANNLP
jgi:hypothetical protein